MNTSELDQILRRHYRLVEILDRLELTVETLDRLREDWDRHPGRASVLYDDSKRCIAMHLEGSE